MAGGMHGRRGPGAPLGARAAAARASPEQSLHAAPCWLQVAADGGGRSPGVVLAWRKNESGKWEALVAAWVDAGLVRQRQESGPADPDSATG